jgi:membrane-bound metal-dependent hydrolase YbcI (DUF457 family)
MADFKTHITTSSVVGVVYGAAGYFYFQLPPSTCGLSAGLCSVAGMLPDLDSDSGIPVRETMSFAAAIAPSLMIERWQNLGLGHESIALACVLTYLVVRFGIGTIFKHYTVHRGMWHSIPAAASAGLLAFLLCSSEDWNSRVYKSVAVVVGFVTHLVLDEIWSVNLRGVMPKFKKSFGTALKFWGDDRWANVSTYGKLILLFALATGDPVFMNWMGYHHKGLPMFAQQWLDKARTKSQDAVRRAEEALRRNQQGPNSPAPNPTPAPTDPTQPPVIGLDGWPIRR